MDTITDIINLYRSRLSKYRKKCSNCGEDQIFGFLFYTDQHVTNLAFGYILFTHRTVLHHSITSNQQCTFFKTKIYSTVPLQDVPKCGGGVLSFRRQAAHPGLKEVSWCGPHTGAGISGDVESPRAHYLRVGWLALGILSERLGGRSNAGSLQDWTDTTICSTTDISLFHQCRTLASLYADLDLGVLIRLGNVQHIYSWIL